MGSPMACRDCDSAKPLVELTESGSLCAGCAARRLRNGERVARLLYGQIDEWKAAEDGWQEAVAEAFREAEPHHAGFKRATTPIPCARCAAPLGAVYVRTDEGDLCNDCAKLADGGVVFGWAHLSALAAVREIGTDPAPVAREQADEPPWQPPPEDKPTYLHGPIHVAYTGTDGLPHPIGSDVPPAGGAGNERWLTAADLCALVETKHDAGMRLAREVADKADMLQRATTEIQIVTAERNHWRDRVLHPDKPCDCPMCERVGYFERAWRDM